MSNFQKFKQADSSQWKNSKPSSGFGARPARNTEYNKQGSDDAPNTTMTDALIALDLELMKLLVKRSNLLLKAKTKLKGQTLTNLEKDLRKSFELNSASFSRDPRFSRQFFNLIQDIEVVKSKAEIRDAFILNPTRKPVDIAVVAPANNELASLFIALAAFKGTEIKIENVAASDQMNDFIKALNTAEAELYWNEAGDICNRKRKASNKSLDFPNNSIYAGDELLSFCLVSFLSTLQTCRCRIAGGNNLKLTDLRPLRNFLPQLGARLAHQMPGSSSIPVFVESSFMFNEELEINKDLFAGLPEGQQAHFVFCFISALLVALLLAEKKFTIKLVGFDSECPECYVGFKKAKFICEELFKKCSAQIEFSEDTIKISPNTLELPSRVTLSADPILSSFMLSLPLVHGGKASLNDSFFIADEYTDSLINFLTNIGLDLSCDAQSLGSERPAAWSNCKATKVQAEDIKNLPLNFRPIALALLSVLVLKGCRPVEIDLAFCTKEFLDIAQEFFTLLDLEYSNNTIHPKTRDASEPTPATDAWASPDSYWTLALALASLQRPGLSLLNPKDMNYIWPLFWTFFNSLPTPDFNVKKKEDLQNEPTKRRLIAK